MQNKDDRFDRLEDGKNFALDFVLDFALDFALVFALDFALDFVLDLALDVWNKHFASLTHYRLW